MEDQKTFSGNSVKLLESRRIIMGYKGWAPSAAGYPPFCDFAKKVLRLKGAEKFE
jgi:hypothetical protein